MLARGRQRCGRLDVVLGCGRQAVLRSPVVVASASPLAERSMPHSSPDFPLNCSLLTDPYPHWGRQVAGPCRSELGKAGGRVA